MIPVHLYYRYKPLTLLLGYYCRNVELFWAGRESKEPLESFKVIHIWSIIKLKQDLIHCIIRIYYQTIRDCKWTWFNLYFHALSIAAFGFCEYKEPESTLRSLRLLHDLQIGDKSLLVKVDAKTKAQLDEWKAKKKTANGVYFLYSLISVSGFVASGI